MIRPFWSIRTWLLQWPGRCGVVVPAAEQPAHAVSDQRAGEQQSFAQSGFEATSATWLFSGETVRVEVPCLDGGDSVTLALRDGRIVWVDPPPVTSTTGSARRAESHRSSERA